MSEAEKSREKRARGRPRDPGVRKAILAAAYELLEAGGLTAVTVDAISQRSGISRPTIYRYWPNAHAVAMAAFLEFGGTGALKPRRRGALSELRAHLAGIAGAFATRTGRSVAALTAAAQSETEIAKSFRNQFVLRSREEGRALLVRAIEEGEIRAGTDIQVALDMLYGPIYFRLLIGHAPLDARFTGRLLDQLLAGISAGTNENARHRGDRGGGQVKE